MNDKHVNDWFLFFLFTFLHFPKVLLFYNQVGKIAITILLIYRWVFLQIISPAWVNSGQTPLPKIPTQLLASWREAECPENRRWQPLAYRWLILILNLVFRSGNHIFKDIGTLGHVQRRMTKIIRKVDTMSYLFINEFINST